MKNTKRKLLIMLALVGLVAAPSVARAADGSEANSSDKPKTENRGQGARGDRTREQMKRLSEELKLTDEQKSKVEPVLKDEAAKLRELRGNNSLSQEERRTKARESRQAIAAKLKNILTPEQYQQWQKLRQQRAPQRTPQQ